MDDPTIEPPDSYSELGPAPPSNSSNVVAFAKPRKRVSAKTERLIGELGLRYRPSAQADLEEHAAALALLTTDVAEIPPDILEQAIRRHVGSSPYMPKASELIAIAQQIVAPVRSGAKPVDMAARRNAAPDMPSHLRWVYDEQGQIRLETV